VSLTISDRFEERRRTTRLVVRDGCEVAFGLARVVRLVDISMSGALMRALQDWPIGQRAELRTTLGDNTFVVHVEVRRVASESAQGEWAGGYRIGVAFVSLDPQNRRCLERFLKQPASS
jgi:c-di-GMP-binding flagellar brake protein YcgR